ncbi:MAG: DUF2796 domain-containing protein [Deltaproteobacteria bacterium]|jgi:hypothetical protein|nr:DUF2796 domain-containing protein [Deltaproteobacteria bacterium]
MKKSFLLLFLFCSPVFAVAAAYAHGPHEHGVAHMNIAVEGGTVEIELETPLANLLSFEHAPESAAQKDEARHMALLLHRADELFLFPAAARCRSAEIELESGALSAELLAPPAGGEAARPAAGAAAPAPEKHEGEEEHEGEEGHADLDAAFTFHCANPAALNSLELDLFKKFPGVNEIEAQLITGKGQKAAELTPGENRLRW